MTINVLNEFLPPAEDIRRGAIKVGETLDIDDNNVLNVDSSAVLGSYYSNVITEIPQNIKYTLNNGVLTIKAGTKTYIPDGFEEDGITKKFREYIVTHDASYPISHVTGASRLVAISDSNATYGYLAHYWFSGDTAPVIGGSCGWYDTANNVIKISSSDGSSWSTPNVSLPLLGGAYTKDYGFNSIDNVFNGAGYAGHHAFILPGVKGLVADGKDDKGAVKSVIEEVNTVRIHDLTEVFKHSGTTTYNNNFLFLDYDNESTKVAPYYSFKNLSELQNLPASFQYIYETNIMYEKESGLEVTWGCLPFIEVSLKDSQVTYFNILQPLRIANTEDRIDTTGTFLFDYKWTDHIPNKLSWIDSSLFSWVDGNVYKGAYEELLTAWNGSYTQKTDNGVTYRDTAKGYQIAGPDQEANIISAWNSQHAAWFYILDITNKRFKLPRLGSKEIVETYKNGRNWYRLYADDWCEQGGSNVTLNEISTATITYLVPMADTNYTLLAIQTNQSTASDAEVGIQFTAKSNTQGVLSCHYINPNTTYVSWEIKGFSNFNAPTTSSYGPVKHLYFYMGYSDLDRLKQGEIDINAVTNRGVTQVNTATEEGINRLNTDSNALNRTQITNCITEIPQDIKLELNNGTLTLKAGSKVYVPNGFETDGTTPKFDVVITSTDLSKKPTGNTNTMFIFYNYISNTLTEEIGVSSGPTISPPGTYHTRYDTTINKIIRSIDGSVWDSSYQDSLPIAYVSADTTAGITNINNIFNGFGYIGSTAFVLPGVKGLIPNGRNADGTLNNIKLNTTRILMHTFTYTGPVEFRVRNSVSDSVPNYWFYDEVNNRIKHNSTITDTIVFATGYETNGTISNFVPKVTFNAINYCNIDFVISYQKPTSANNYTWYRLYKSGWVEQGGLATTKTDGNTTATLPIPMQDTNYTALLTSNSTTNTFNSAQADWINAKTTTNFTIHCDSYGTVASWIVKGFAAV